MILYVVCCVILCIVCSVCVVSLWKILQRRLFDDHKKGLDKPVNLWYILITVEEAPPRKRRENITMINIRTIRKLTENDGLTLKNGKKITYKSGWQVATEGVEVKTARECMDAVKAYDGNCGVWYSGGIYYVDKSHRVSTKREAMEIGRECKQISVLRWRDLSLAYC